jgi:hypothetical protein
MGHCGSIYQIEDQGVIVVDTRIFNPSCKTYALVRADLSTNPA